MKLKKISSKSGISGKDKIDCYIIDADEKTARSITASLKQKNFKGKIAVMGRDDNFNRRALETLNISYLISPEKNHYRDTLKQRDSGLNHVLAKIARQNSIEIIIDFADVNSIDSKKQKALRLSRIIQNIKICRKAGCNIKIWDFTNKADKKQLQSFGFSLGMSSQQAGNL